VTVTHQMVHDGKTGAPNRKSLHRTYRLTVTHEMHIVLDRLADHIVHNERQLLAQTLSMLAGYSCQ